VLGAGGVGVAAAASGGSTPASAGGSGYGASPSASGAGGRYGSSPAPAPVGVSVTTVATPLGRTLVDGDGRTLYLFEADHGGTSACTGSCDTVWPPLRARGGVHALGGVSAALLGTIQRSDGSTQVSYNGHPLYYYAGDAKPGDTTGQGLNQFGASWYVLDPAGARIDHD
jgi:predicted lipoprotein with Yx(FWY)xxD motif